MQCIACYSTCLSCQNNEISACITCQSGYYLTVASLDSSIGSCLKTCDTTISYYKSVING